MGIFKWIYNTIVSVLSWIVVIPIAIFVLLWDTFGGFIFIFIIIIIAAANMQDKALDVNIESNKTETTQEKW